MDLKKYPRSAGGLLFIAGACASGWFYTHALDDASHQSRAEIAVPHAFGALVAIATIGLCLMIWGEKVQLYSQGLKGRKKTPKDALIIFLLILPALLFYILLHYQLTQLGYHQIA